MPILSPKRQVTLPKELCDRLGVEPGDDLLILEHQGRITILKRTKGRGAGLLNHLKADPRFSEGASLWDSLERRRAQRSARRREA
jgi:AbrB family looped-hinge helix DNA binding protein